MVAGGHRDVFGCGRKGQILRDWLPIDEDVDGGRVRRGVDDTYRRVRYAGHGWGRLLGLGERWRDDHETDDEQHREDAAGMEMGLRDVVPEKHFAESSLHETGANGHRTTRTLARPSHTPYHLETRRPRSVVGPLNER